MIIPNSLRQQVVKKSSPLENNYFLHAESALRSMKRTEPEAYCYDDISKAANTLERIYKGFLQAAHDHCEFYTLPSSNFLTQDHDILGMVLEIKQHFPDVFPRVDRSEWQATKNFYRDLRMEYSDSRYVSYPDYSDFLALRTFVEQQSELITDYIKEGNLTKSTEFDFENQL